MGWEGDAAAEVDILLGGHKISAPRRALLYPRQTGMGCVWPGCRPLCVIYKQGKKKVARDGVREGGWVDHTEGGVTVA